MEGEEFVEEQHFPGGALPYLDEKSSARPRLTPSPSSSSPGAGPSRPSSNGNFSHFDEKLSARATRRAALKEAGSKHCRNPSEEAEGRLAINAREEPGFEISQEKLGPGTYFLVVVRRGLVGLERFEEQAIY